MAQERPDGGFDPRKVYETLAPILNRREGIEVRLVSFRVCSPEKSGDHTTRPEPSGGK